VVVLKEERECILNVECQEVHGGGRDVVVLQFVHERTEISYEWHIRRYNSAIVFLIPGWIVKLDISYSKSGISEFYVL
jgi:hypothetical protein